MTFDGHLNECAQCREHPFALCRVGAALLERAGARVFTAEHAAAHAPTGDADPRFNMGLVFEVLQVLKKHGYQPATDPRCYADALVDILHLTASYEGRGENRRG